METSPSIKTMAFAVQVNITRSDLVGLVTDRVGKTPQTRGFVKDGRQMEQVIATKLTGDTTGSIDLTAIDSNHVHEVRSTATLDSAGAVVTDNTATWIDIPFTVTDVDTIALTGMGDWTNATISILGRST